MKVRLIKKGTQIANREKKTDTLNENMFLQLNQNALTSCLEAEIFKTLKSWKEGKTEI